jgi:glutathione S-transferase
MLELLTFRAAFGQPSGSPFCVKAMCMLQMAGVEWQRVDMDDPRRMPSGKLPVLREGTTLIPDSEGIRTYLESRGADFEPGLTPPEKAASRAIVRMADEHLYFLVLQDRWGNDRVWPHLRAAYFRSIPALFRGIVTPLIRADVLRGLRAQGIGRLSDDQRMARAEADLTALGTLVSAQDFLFGARPTAADCSVAPMLVAMTASPVPTALSTRVSQDHVLSAYCRRVTEAIYPPTGVVTA